ncbi:MAG: long-chain fatty acid--CoA ligase [Pyrinomonadaceae bacterium]|nr:long-chain fatty acid--CoA ligase [Pyrinomonadaceae bacterium]
MQIKPENSTRRAVQRIPLLEDEPRTLPELFIKSAKKHNRKDALSFKKNGKWQKISSAEMIERIENIALGLYSIGLRKDDRAAILAANSPEWTFSDAGCQFAGIIDVPIYTTLAPNSICYVIKDSGAKIFFLENKEFYEYIKDILPECNSLEKLIFFDDTGVEAENAVSLKDLEEAGAKLKEENPHLLENLVAAVQPDDVATLIYTSGTTGEPKGVMLSHTNIVSNTIDAGEKYEFSKDDKSLSVLPLSHVFERSAMYLYILNGMAVHYAESIDKVPDNLQEVRPTIFVGVPRIFEKVYAKAKLKASQSSELKEKVFDWAIETGKEVALRKEKRQNISFFLSVKHSIADRLVFSKLRDFFGGNLRSCITGGAALSNEIWLIFTGAGISIMQGYGLTETSPVISSNNPIDAKLGTVGKPIRGIKVRIAEDGEIEVLSPGMLLGYYNKPEATHDAFTADGWFKTGDIGKIDDEGFLEITDRKKELFKTSGGKYIAPAHIEQILKGSRFVNQVVLVGNDRKFPAALIVPNFEQLESYARHKHFPIETHAEFCKDPRIIDLFERQIEKLTKDLSQYEKVKKFALLEDELTVEGGELTPTLKVKRRVVDEKYQNVIERIYADAEK